MKKYDCIFSLGEACFIAITLKSKNLRMFSAPFDWLYGGTFYSRFELLINDFKGFFQKEDLEFSYIRENGRKSAFHNIKTDIVFNHDFGYVLPFDYEYPLVKRKYDRRITRLLETIKYSKKVLIVYGDLENTKGNYTSIEDIKKYIEEINKKYYPTQIDLLYIENHPDMQEDKISFQEVTKHITIAHCCSHKLKEGNVITNEKIMKKVFKNITVKGKFYNDIKSFSEIFYRKKENYVRILCFKFKNKINLAKEYSARKYVLENKENVTNLVIGSSHANRDFNSMFTAQPSINLGTTSQDLYQSYELCKYALKYQKNIKKCILFYSPFTPGYNTQHSSEKYRCAYLKKIFDISPLEEFDKKTQKTLKKIKCDNQKSYNIYDDNNPLIGYESYIENDVKVRAQKHLEISINSKNENMHFYLQKLNDLLKENEIKFIIIVPPYTDVYKRYLPEEKVLFHSLYEFVKNNKVDFISYYNDPDFDTSDSYDADHLNNIGAIKLTRKINEVLQ